VLPACKRVTNSGHFLVSFYFLLGIILISRRIGERSVVLVENVRSAVYIMLLLFQFALSETSKY
jgi:hypothetical protein